MQKFVLVAVAKNEGKFIKEWVAYHKFICGFDEIVIYNNDSEDQSVKVLSDLSERNWCRWIDWPRGANTPPQITAYHNAVRNFKNEKGWLCFLDMDEFLVLKKHSNISNFVQDFAENTGSISFNWAMFYSTDEKSSKEPVTKRITSISEENGHVKTIARLDAIRVPCIHSFRLAPGFRYMHCSGFDYKIDLNELSSIKMSLDASLCVRRPHVDCSVAQINHYKIKSREDCLNRDNRGRATYVEFRSSNSIHMYEKLCRTKKEKHNFDMQDSIQRIMPNFYDLLNT
jgi:hypothetical protein